MIEYSNILVDDLKKSLISRVNSMSDEEIESLGKFLAKEQEISDESYEKDINKIDEAIATINEMQKDGDIED